MKSAETIKDVKEIIYPGAPHGIRATNQDEIDSEPLRSLRPVFEDWLDKSAFASEAQRGQTEKRSA